jgi:hypothetical protein
MNDEVYKRVLVIMHKQIMPHLVNPRLLIDFLTESYERGGVISVLALNGLFILMTEHNLYGSPKRWRALALGQIVGSKLLLGGLLVMCRPLLFIANTLRKVCCFIS